MHTSTTVKNWMHFMHDEGVRAVHFTSHLLHEKSFWGILAFVAVMAALFTLLMMYGNNTMIQHYGTPTPYIPVY